MAKTFKISDKKKGIVEKEEIPVKQEEVVELQPTTPSVKEEIVVVEEVVVKEKDTPEDETEERKDNLEKENKKTKRLVPIMEIYPSDNSLVRDRIQFKEGDRLPVDPDIVVADGGADYFMLLTPAGRGGEELYIRYKDCEEMW